MAAPFRTFLDLTNTLVRELNEVELSSVSFANAKGIQKYLKDAINRAYFDIVNEEPQWPFLSLGESGETDPMYGNVYVETVAGTRWYELKPASSDITTAAPNTYTHICERRETNRSLRAGRQANR